MELQAERQSLRTRVELQRQAGGMSGSFDRDDPFWKEEVFTGGGPSAGEEELLLPTDVPRDKAAEKRLYRELARRFHPDLGQTALEIAYRTEMMTAVNKAYAAGDNQALYDLAGELDPEAVAAVEAISSAEIRRLKRQLVRLQQRRRRVKQRLVVSREENTARLWRKAQRLETDDTHWWEVVRREIERAIERLEKEVARLSEMIEPPQEGEQAQVGT
jgi:curved DNA-binding protein CbpA